jgi:Ca-activated chloride channel family protein
VKVDGFQMQTALDEDTLKSIAQATSGAYHPASDTNQLDGVASSIKLRLTVTDKQVPLAGAFIGLALALLAVGSVSTIFRSGRVI